MICGLSFISPVKAGMIWSSSVSISNSWSPLESTKKRGSFHCETNCRKAAGLSAAYASNNAWYVSAARCHCARLEACYARNYVRCLSGAIHFFRAALKTMSSHPAEGKHKGLTLATVDEDNGTRGPGTGSQNPGYPDAP